jgi:hypothetical protein
MKKIIMSTVAATMTFAGGNIAPVEPVEVAVEVAAPVESGFYVGAGYSYIDTTVKAYGLSADEGIDAGTILAGYDVNKYFAIEGRYAFSADVDFGNARADFDGDVWGIFAKPQYPVNEDFKVYALLGYGETSLVNDGGSFQYGLGGAYSVTEKVAVFADWVRAYDDEDEITYVLGDGEVTQDAFTVGLTYSF